MTTRTSKAKTQQTPAGETPDEAKATDSATTTSTPDADAPDPYDIPESTTLDEDVTRPSTTAPGDGPADTTDPNERAVSVSPSPGEDALKAGTVNAVRPAPAAPAPTRRKAKDRVERYVATRPDGTEVTVERNIETGESKLVG